MTEQPEKIADSELRYLAESGAHIGGEVTRSLAAEVLELRQKLAELDRLHSAASQAADYGRLYGAIEAGVKHVLDWQDEWRKLTRDELIEKLMITHRAGLNPRISEAIVGLAASAARPRITELEAEVLELRQKLTDARELARGYQLLTAGAEEEITELAAFTETVKAFINRRPEVITAIEERRVEDADYWRWQGHAEAMGNLARDLGLTVPHKPGETTEPVKPKEATTNA